VPAPALTLLGEADREHLHEAALGVLADTGARFDSPRARAVLKDAGCQVDEDAGVVRFPNRIVDWALSKLRREVVLASRSAELDLVLDGSTTHTSTTDICPYVVDVRTGEIREPALDDLAQIGRLVDALPEVDHCTFAVSPTADVSAGMLDLASLACLLANTGKHVHGQLIRPEDVPIALEIVRLAAPEADIRHRPIFSSLYCPISPLLHGRAESEAAMAMADAGLPIDVFSLALAGATAPLTLAGAVVQTLAEEFSALVLLKVVNQDCPVILTGNVGVLDMSTSRYVSATPEACLMDLALLEMIASYGAPSQSIGFSNDSFDTGFLCGQEGMAIALFTWLARADIITGLGNIAGAQVFSLAKLALDAEVVQYLGRLHRGLDLDEEHMAVEVIRRVGPCGHYLKEKQTLRALRAGEQWVPSLFRRRSQEQVQAGLPDAVALAARRVDDLLASHAPPALPAGAPEAIDEALAEAALERGLPAPRVTTGQPREAHPRLT
jgi:trimethylamine---corrinoid protein Co-methyltransferase